MASPEGEEDEVEVEGEEELMQAQASEAGQVVVAAAVCGAGWGGRA